jgi:hypothetical protein
MTAAFSALIVLLLAGCGTTEWFRLLAPDAGGFERVSARLWVEAGTDSVRRRVLEAEIDRAERVIAAAYGSVAAQPVVHACVSEGCYRAFGGRGATRAKLYFGSRILLSPRGLNWHYIAHEWSHAEMVARLNLPAFWRLPRWFDEGVAVAISEAPETDAAHWRFLVDRGIPRPTGEELRRLDSYAEWNAAIGRYGEAQNLERQARGEAEIRPVYTAAGEELRAWLAKVGRDGLLALIAAMNDGAAFASLYRPAAHSPVTELWPYRATQPPARSSASRSNDSASGKASMRSAIGQASLPACTT